MSDGNPSPVEALLRAEKQADEIVARAKTEAEQIVAAAHKRAGEIRGGAGLRGNEETAVSRRREELERQKRVISEHADRMIEEMRSVAQAKLKDAVERVFLELVGEP